MGASFLIQPRTEFAPWGAPRYTLAVTAARIVTFGTAPIAESKPAMNAS
jgi:hypothetical protein